MRYSSHRVRLGTATVVLVAALAVAVGLATAASKPYSVTLSPGSVATGDDVAVAATFTNRTSQQELGSADLTPPSGFVALSASLPAGTAGSATVSGNVVQLRDLGLPPGQSFTVNMVVRVPCAGGGSDWTVVAKQANNFSGSPGNDLTLDESTSSLATTPTGACDLRFTTQPKDAEVGATITGRAFDPSGPPVAVEVLDSTGDRMIASTAPVTMSLTGGPGTLSGTRTVNASNGVASFGDLAVGSAGSYALRADGAGGSDTSDAFSVGGTSKQCNEDDVGSGPCQTSFTGPAGSTLTLLAPPGSGPDAGLLTIALSSTALDCDGYTERPGDEFVFDGPAGRAKSATLTFAPDPVRPISLSDPLEVCFGSPVSFAPKQGTSLKEEDPNEDGTVDRYVGRLPDCAFDGDPERFAPPCVTARDDAERTISYDLPVGDPYSR